MVELLPRNIKISRLLIFRYSKVCPETFRSRVWYDQRVRYFFFKENPTEMNIFERKYLFREGALYTLTLTLPHSSSLLPLGRYASKCLANANTTILSVYIML